MKKLAAIFATSLLTGCITVQYPEPKEQASSVQYAVFQVDHSGKLKSGEPSIKNSHFPLFPPVNDDACDDSCKSACQYIYKHDDYKYHDCVNTQRWWNTPSLKPLSLSDNY